MSILSSLDLPEASPIVPVPVATQYYGAAAVAARHCGIPETVAAVPGNWQHGYAQHYRQTDPIVLLGSDGVPEKKGEWHWVARKDEEAFLRSCGYEKVKAIGLPMVYLPPRQLPRVPGSLLVMPAHSLDFTTHAWDSARYAEEIGAIRSAFSEVVVCIHPSCWKHRYWVDAFQSRGFPVVHGAFNADRNSLERIRTLLSSFEYVTTNSFGSLLAYAASFGAKVSMYGTFAEYRREDFTGETFWESYPQQLTEFVEAHALATIQRHYGDFFCHPLDAPLRLEWGRHEIGADNRLPPEEMRELFGWTEPALCRAYDAHLTECRPAMAQMKEWAEKLEEAKAWLLEKWQESKDVVAYQQRQIEQLQEAQRGLEEALAALRSSRTWKAGRLVLLPTTALRWTVQAARGLLRPAG